MSVLFLRSLLLHQQHLAACCGSVVSTRRLAGAPANSAQQPADAPSTSAPAAAPSPVELKLRRSAKVHPVMPCNLMQPCSTQPCFNPVTIRLPASADTYSFARHHSSLIQRPWFCVCHAHAAPGCQVQRWPRLQLLCRVPEDKKPLGRHTAHGHAWTRTGALGPPAGNSIRLMLLHLMPSGAVVLQNTLLFISRPRVAPPTQAVRRQL